MNHLPVIGENEWWPLRFCLLLQSRWWWSLCPAPSAGSDLNRMVRYGQWRLWIGSTDPWRALLCAMWWDAARENPPVLLTKKRVWKPNDVSVCVDSRRHCHTTWLGRRWIDVCVGYIRSVDCVPQWLTLCILRMGMWHFGDRGCLPQVTTH